MPLNKALKLLFIHNPKCGGSTLETFFGMNNKSNGVNKAMLYGLMSRQKPSFVDLKDKKVKHVFTYTIPLQHLTLDKIIEEKFLTFDDFDKYFSFSLVRNPWDKIVSSYVSHFKVIHPTFSGYLNWVKEIVEFEKSGEFFIYQEKNRRHTINTHLTEQHRFVNFGGEQLVNYVGKYENFAEEVKYICSVVGKPYTVPPVINQTKNKQHYSVYYTDEQAELIGKLYAEDIRLFDYKFERK